jgi:hypothetical protein
MFKVIRIIGLQPILSMQLWSINIDIKQLIDYQSSQHQSHNTCVTIMKVPLLRFDTAIKSSLISESVAEIPINIHFVREKPDNTTHARSLGPYVR